MTSKTRAARRMTSVLLDCGLVTPDQVEQAAERQAQTGRMIGETLVELGYTTEDSIIWALSKQLGIPYADVKPEALDADLVRRFPESLLRRTQAVPLFRSPDGTTIACADPSDTEAVTSLQEAAEGAVSFVIGGPASIRYALDTILGPVRPAAARDRAALHAGNGTAPGAPVSPSDVVWDREGRSFLLFHLHAAREKGASEIHFTPTASGLNVSYRTDGGLESQANELPETALYLRARLHALGIPDLDHGATARGSMAVELDGGRVSCGVFHARTAAGVATVIRLAPASEQAPELSALGVAPIAEAEIREFLDGPEGLIVVTGPPRSGGSLVLASLASIAARPERRILVLDEGSTAPYPRDAVRIHPAPGALHAERWDTLALGLGADVVVLDGILRGEAIAEVLSGVAVGRLVFARTDWLESKSLLRFLAAQPTARSVLRDRPFALMALPSGRMEGSTVWAPIEEDARAGSIVVTLLTDEDRDALAGGGKAR